MGSFFSKRSRSRKKHFQINELEDVVENDPKKHFKFIFTEMMQKTNQKTEEDMKLIKDVTEENNQNILDVRDNIRHLEDKVEDAVSTVNSTLSIKKKELEQKLFPINQAYLNLLEEVNSIRDVVNDLPELNNTEPLEKINDEIIIEMSNNITSLIKKVEENSSTIWLMKQDIIKLNPKGISVNERVRTESFTAINLGEKINK